MLYVVSEVDSAEDVVELATTWRDQFWIWFSNMSMWQHVLFASIRILLIFLLTRLFVKIVFKIIDRSLDRKEKSRLNMNPRRFVTVGELLKNVTSIVSNFIMIMLVLGEVGVELAPLLAGAGVVGLAVGFGAQSLVKDVITGFFIILEDQFAVGDVIQTGTTKGTVEMIGLRTTRIISWTGEVNIIPNGMFTNVTNYSLNKALAVVDLPFSNERQLEEIKAMLHKSMVQLEEKSDIIEQVPKVMGIQSLTAGEFVIRIVVECIPGLRGETERQITAAAKMAMEHEEMKKMRLQKGVEG